MKKSMIVLIAVLLVLVLAMAFAACNKEHVHSDADGDDFCDDCGAFIGEPKSMEGSAFVQDTVAKVGGLAERGAAVMANDAFTLGATAEVAVNGSVYTLRADVNVNGTDADANEFAVTLTHDGATVLGVYLASRVLYIDDGTGVRAYDLFEGGSDGDLASLLGGLAGRAYEEGEVSGTIVDGAGGFLAASAIRILSSGATATVRGNTGEVTLPLAVNIKKVIPLLGAIDLGFDISVLGDVIGSVLGASWEDLNDLDVELDPASTAQLTIRTKFDETALTEVGLTYTLKETVVSLDVDFRCRNTTYKYLLLPVYVGHCNWKKKLFNFFVNGRNGKVTGKTPVSPLKVGALVLLGLAAVAGLVVLFLWMNGIGPF